MSIDLHLHTQASDGTLTPEKLIEEAAKAGLKAVAITDHDTTDSLAAGAKAAAREGLAFIPGVEISASYNPDTALHFLGYGIDPADQRLQEILAFNQAAWDKSEEDSIEALERLKITIDPKRYDYWKNHRQLGGWPLFNVMKEMGLVADVQEYFDKYFGLGKPAYITIEFVSPPEAIAAIKKAGGAPILAHPGLYYDGVQKLITQADFRKELISWGVRGLEAIASGHSEEETNYLLTYCQSYNLLVTGGSDFHGGFAGRTLGLPQVDDAYLAPLLDEINASRSPSLVARHSYE